VGLDKAYGCDLTPFLGPNRIPNWTDSRGQVTLNMLSQETSAKRGIKGKRLKAGWDHAYLLKLLEL
jgi:hypothetical protein